MGNVEVFFYALVVTALAVLLSGCPIRPILGG